MEDLKRKLIEHNVSFHPLTQKEIYDQILNNNVSAEFFRFIHFTLGLIGNVKSNVNREKFPEIIQDYILKQALPIETKKEMVKEANLFIELYKYYEQELLPKNKIDFSDMIYYANKYIGNIAKTNLLNYDYIIIDEYQDISLDRYQFAKNISILSNAKVASVGDDWQTIFSFAGSRIDLFLKYNQLFPGAKQLFINSTYRNSQQLINVAGNFIMKNPFQIKKQLTSQKKRESPIKFYLYQENQEQLVNEILGKIQKENPQDKVLILARKNKHISNLLLHPSFEEGIGTRIIAKKFPNMIIDAMSVHSAKGLGADHVILLNVTNKDFPCSEVQDIWISNLFKPQGYDEEFPHAEERRIFYVALTRTKKDIYLLIPKNEQNRSPFIKELLESNNCQTSSKCVN